LTELLETTAEPGDGLEASHAHLRTELNARRQDMVMTLARVEYRRVIVLVPRPMTFSLSTLGLPTVPLQ
jgi:hypothetical protein